MRRIARIMKKILIVGIILIGALSFFPKRSGFEAPISIPSEDGSASENMSRYESETIVEEKEEIEIVAREPEVIMKRILQEVPFTSQAPMGNWSELIFQNACEEASLLMADKWASGGIFGTAEERESEIRLITKEEERFFPKNTYDLSAEDTLFLAKSLYPEMNISLVENISKENIISALVKESIAIIPANGQKLGNPNFTAPGPLYHMLLIRGYDPVSDEFITNDPGTRRGELYRYKTDILFDAMQDYETGYHGKIFPDEKVMLLIQK